MADKPKKEKVKEDCYLGCIPKTEVPKFIDNLKDALGKSSKTGDEKEFTFEVRGTKDEPKGVSLEMYSVNKTNFDKFLDKKQPYMAKALSVLSFSVGIKNKDNVKVLTDLWEKFKPLVMEHPRVKKHPNKFEFHIRSTDTRVFLDVVNVEGKFLQPLLDLNLDITEFHKFNFSLKSEFRPDEFFTAPVEELALKGLQLVLSCKGESKNSKYLVSALADALKKVKLSNNKYQKKLDKTLSFLNFINAFVASRLKFEFNAKELCQTGLEVSKDKSGQDVNQVFAGFRGMVEAGGAQVKPMLEQHGLLEAAKLVNIDEITICTSIPKYENGGAIVVSLPGFSNAFCNKFLA